MIIGNGMLARAFEDFRYNDRFLIFASGVSNSNELRNKEFKREEKLLLESLKDNGNKLFVYFSSCDVVYADVLGNAYYYHKQEMEEIVKREAREYYIFRLPQIVGTSNNKHSLINFFIDSIFYEKEFFLWDSAYKNIIDIDDAKKMVKHVINGRFNVNYTMNIINKKNYPVSYIVELLEEILKKKAKVKIINKGFKPEYMTSHYFDEFNSVFGDEYLKTSLIKHYTGKQTTQRNLNDVNMMNKLKINS